MSGLRKSEILRGYRAFSPVFRRGSRHDGRLLRAVVSVVPSGVPRVVVGFSVPARMFGAVRRNRLKRLMREAFVAERGPLLLAAAERAAAMQVVLVFKGSDTPKVRRLRCADLRSELALLVSGMARSRGPRR